jgi:hypothetical protein
MAVWQVLGVLGTTLLSACFGYFVGNWKAFRDQKHQAYAELLPDIVRFAYDTQAQDEPAFSRGLMKLWLYASAPVALKMDRAVALIHTQSREGLTEALQCAVIEMRKDTQPLWWLPGRRLRPNDVRHLYTKVQ